MLIYIHLKFGHQPLPMRRIRFIHWLLIASPGILLALILVTCNKKDEAGNEVETVVSSGGATFTGRQACKECHPGEYDLFTGSDHDKAMDRATDATVLGDFGRAFFMQQGTRTDFYTGDDRFYVRTEGPDGSPDTFRVKYTFGVRPLQQYLVEFPGGRLQVLPFCWDSRTGDEGGQRWFHIYGDERIAPDDVLFWTRIMQNWNYMCSECHSTNLRKQYDRDTKTYNTTWSEIDVSCEACHGPGSEHVAWARTAERGESQASFTDMGLVVRLKDPDRAMWVFDQGATTARRSLPRKDRTMVDLCSRCHSRRSVITEDYVYGRSLLDSHWPSLLDEGLYFPDGQIREEVYVYASFLQSKMYKAGVVCTDCHEVHSGRIYANGNALCYRCHLAEKYGSREHHHHPSGSTGTLCYECHMPERTYMQIDPRRDHSIRVPRPDLSDRLGTPNACNRCHDDKTNRWAASWLDQWYGRVEGGKTHYGEVFLGARKAYPEAWPGLLRLSEDGSLPPMIRANALALLRNYPRDSSWMTLQAALTDQDPLIRYGAVSAIDAFDPRTVARTAPVLLADSIRLIRIFSAFQMAGIPSGYFDKKTLRLREEATQEYIESQLINADHPSAHLNLGNLYMNRGDFSRSEEAFKTAISLEPGFVAATINLADLYRAIGRDEKGRQLLESALEKYPGMAAVQYAMGLLLVRQGAHAEALEYLKKAAVQEPDNPRYSYVYGVALNSEGRSGEAVRVLKTALEQHPYDRDILYSVATILVERKNPAEALPYAEKLVKYYPRDASYRELLDYLRKN